MITNTLISSSEHSLFLLKALCMTVWQSESMMENTMMVLCEKNIQQLAQFYSHLYSFYYLIYTSLTLIC